MTLRNYQKTFVNDVLNAYHRGSKAVCGVLPCGAGKTVVAAKLAELAGRTSKDTLFLVHRRELVEQTLKKMQSAGLDMDRVQVEMVQTLRRDPQRVKPDLIITDEGHHSLAKSYYRIYASHPHALRLSLTATPIRLGGRGLGDIHDTLVEGVSARWLIQHGYLADYDYYAPRLVETTELHTRAGEYVAAEVNELMDRPVIYGDALQHYLRIASGKQAILYAASINLSKLAAETFSNAGIPAAHIDGKTPSSKRDSIISAFRTGGIQVLCNVDIVGEGFDAPDCEAVIMLRPTASLALHIQQSMRCMRPKNGKRAIIIDHVNNVMRHGLPDDKREWRLDTEPKKTRKRKEKEPSLIRTCPECFRVCARVNRDCPYCGHTFAVEKQLVVDEAAKLEKIARKGFKVKYIKNTPDECNNMYELQQYAKSRGYKPGWAYYQAKARGFL